MVARAPLGIGLRLPGVRPRRVLAAGAQGPDLAVRGLPAGDLGDRGHGHAPQPPAAAHPVPGGPVAGGPPRPRSPLPLRTWFLAAWLVATHKNGMSARQLWLQLGLGSCKSAW